MAEKIIVPNIEPNAANGNPILTPKGGWKYSGNLRNGLSLLKGEKITKENTATIWIFFKKN